MGKHIKTLGLAIFCAIFFNSCATYHLSTQSLLTQFAKTQKETKINTFVAFPFYYTGVVTGNNLREIKCQDKKGIEHTIRLTNHTGVRITKKDGNRNTFYFDTLLIQDSTINGAKSHFLGLSINPILLNDIDKIEIQK
jgi:hypothetical protein